MTNTLRISVLLFAVTLPACAADDEADAFVGSWAYVDGTFRVDCGGNIMEFAASSSLVETITVGESSDLSKSDSMGCAGLTFAVQGGIASLAPSPQSCTIPGMGTSTATIYTLALDGDRMLSHVEGTFQPEGAPSSCALSGSGTLARQ